MLDLNKLEEQLDNALLNETNESLTNFILSKRFKAILAYFGEEGEINVMPAQTITFNPETHNQKVSKNREEVLVDCVDNYQMAA